MGYSTYFYGSLAISPPLSQAEAQLINEVDAPASRAMIEALEEAGITVPHSWGPWSVTIENDGTLLRIPEETRGDVGEELDFIVGSLLHPASPLRELGLSELNAFTFDHVVNGVLYAVGDDESDRWALMARDSVITSAIGRMIYNDPDSPPDPQAVLNDLAARLRAGADLGELSGVVEIYKIQLGEVDQSHPLAWLIPLRLDDAGLVEDLTRELLARGCNVERS